MGREARRNQSAAHQAALRDAKQTAPKRAMPVPDGGRTVQFIPASVVEAARGHARLPAFRFSDRDYVMLRDGSLRRRAKGG